jgi:glycosyltransferase involved in cell wall biosynthesis
MFSLHIDTARTWRGGQNQVLLTVNGLRAIGQRASLIAHPDGELLRRAAEGLDLIPIAPRTEMDLSAAWRLSRVVKRLRPDVVHAHDAHGTAMASLGLSLGSPTPAPALIVSRRVDFHLNRNSFSRWKHRQVDFFIAASEAIRKMLIADGVPSERLVPHKGHRHLIEAAHLVVREMPDTRFLILGEGELREQLERQIHDYRLEKHVLLPGFRTDVIGCIKGFDLFVMSSVTEGLGPSLLDAMACSRASVATRAGGLPEFVQAGRTGVLVEPRDHAAMAREIVHLLKDDGLRQQMGEAARARVAERFTVERMVAETAAVYERVAGRPHAADIARQPAHD